MEIEQEHRPKYDIWLHWSITNACNLNCVYCYRDTSNISKEEFKIDIPNLIKTLDKTGKIFKISFTGGGEPFVVRNIVETCVELTKKHYVAFNTNLTSPKIKDFCEEVNVDRVLYIIASLHIKELERFNLMDRYIENFHLCESKGISIHALEVGHPDILRETEKYKSFFENRGIKLIFNHFIGEHNGKKYPDSYTEEELEIIKESGGEYKNHHYQQGKLCNAGYNAAEVDIDGNVRICGPLKEKIGNIYTGIKFKKDMIRCPIRLCGCPLNNIDEYLFNKALEENRTFASRNIWPNVRRIKNTIPLHKFKHLANAIKTL